MALFTPTAESSASRKKPQWFRRRVEESSERTLVSPQMLKRPAGRVIYWAVFALLLVLTLVTFGPLYWMFTSALKGSIEIFQSPPTFWPSCWNMRYPPLSAGPGSVGLQPMSSL